MSDFAGTEYDFAAGSLYGLRGWNMDEFGRLHGVTHHEVWRPGENRSTCKQTDRIPCPEHGKTAAPQDHLPKLATAAVKSKKRKRADDWDVAPWARATLQIGGSLASGRPCGDTRCSYGEYHTVEKDHGFDFDCSCGFWAYDEGGFAPQGKVIGVIEAYGRTTIGTKGFRAEKARIVGLCRAGADTKPLSKSVLTRLATLYPDVMFYDDLDLLVEAHGGVLRAWPEVGEDFWLRPVPAPKESGLITWGGMGTGYSFTIPSSQIRFTGGVA